MEVSLSYFDDLYGQTPQLGDDERQHTSHEQGMNQAAPSNDSASSTVATTDST